MRTPKSVNYWGTGFRVRLIEFRARSDSPKGMPDIRFGKLHRLIAWRVLNKPGRLRGFELYFLRVFADISRMEAARILRTTRRTLINWEDQGGHRIKTSALVELGIRQTMSSILFPGLFIDARDLLMRMGQKENPIVINKSEYEAYPSGELQADALSANEEVDEVVRPYFHHPHELPTSSVAN